MDYLAIFFDIVLHLDKHLEMLVQQYGAWIYAILFAIIFSETGFVVTPFLPGDSLLFVAGALAAVGGMDIVVLLGALVVAAATGNMLNYQIGRYIGPRVFKWENSLFFNKAALEKTEAFYEKHGGKTIIIARFIPFVRTFAPIIAGVSKMHYNTFLLFNIIGGFLWTFGITSLGYFVGAAFEAAGLDIDHVLLPIIIGIVLLSVAPPAFQILKDKQRRTALWNGFKTEARSIFHSKKK